MKKNRKNIGMKKKRRNVLDREIQEYAERFSKTEADIDTDWECASSEHLLSIDDSDQEGSNGIF